MDGFQKHNDHIIKEYIVCDSVQNQPNLQRLDVRGWQKKKGKKRNQKSGHLQVEVRVSLESSPRTAGSCNGLFFDLRTGYFKITKFYICILYISLVVWYIS